MTNRRTTLPRGFSFAPRIDTSRHFIVPWMILAISVLATAWAWNDTRTQALDVSQRRFNREAAQIERTIRERLLIYEDALRGGQGLFVANKGAVKRDQWRRYVENLRLDERYPGTLGVGFSLRIAPSEKAAHVAQMRSEGFPNYALRPQEERSEYHSIIYLEPSEGRNQRAFGYDMFSEPVRRAAMQRARDTGLPTASSKVTLVQEADQDIQAGFLMYLPVYRESSVLETVEQRRAALFGFVYSPFRMKDLMKGAFGASSPTVGFEIYDGAGIERDALLYDGIDDLALGEAYRPIFSRTSSMELGGHAWTLRFISLPAFDLAIDNREPLLVATGGLAVSLLLFGITWSLATTRRRALTLANGMTAELSESREQFKAVSETANDAIVTANSRGEIVYFNQAATRLFGHSADEAIGQSLTLLMPVRFHESHNQGFKRFLNGGESKVIGKTVELAGRKKDGTEFPLELSLANWHTSGGLFFTAILRDITERKQAETEIAATTRELEAASKLKSEFLANMSHELRTPLNAIIGFTQLMYDGKVGPVSRQHREYMGDILNSSKHLLELINDVLDLSKIEAGKMDFSPEPIELRKLATEVTNILQGLTASKRLTMEVEVSPAVETVMSDPARLKQILYNYLSNAIKFTPDEGRVTIRALPEDADHFRLQVDDTGIGIQPEQMSKLFGEFQQLDIGTAKKHQGTGLGLALTKKLVEVQGGRVGVHSEPGRGSTFYAVLPRAAVQEQKSQSDDRCFVTSSGTAPRVLVIDDNDKDLEWLCKILSEAGYSADTAKTGAEGLAKAQTSSYSAILLDLILPDMAGWDVLHSVRTRGPNRDGPVIIITIVAEKEVAKAFPVEDYLVKPVSPETLVNSLRQAGVHPNALKKRVLVVDDDASARKIASAALQCTGYEPVCHASGQQGLTTAAREDFAPVVLDLLMPEIDGFEFLERFRQIDRGSNFRLNPSP
jgi:PAS domain S-box-containing protein